MLSAVCTMSSTSPRQRFPQPRSRPKPRHSRGQAIRRGRPGACVTHEARVPRAAGSRDQCDIADGYLELARLLVNEGRLRGAICELDEALDILMAPSPEGRSAALPVWPILLTLAALHDGIGDRQRACWFGRQAQADAASCASTVGVSRAARLLTRLSPSCEPRSLSV
jgi:hypothetical protein